jgi:hypothetical protein
MGKLATPHSAGPCCWRDPTQEHDHRSCQLPCWWCQKCRPAASNTGAAHCTAGRNTCTPGNVRGCSHPGQTTWKVHNYDQCAPVCDCLLRCLQANHPTHGTGACQPVTPSQQGRTPPPLPEPHTHLQPLRRVAIARQPALPAHNTKSCVVKPQM